MRTPIFEFLQLFVPALRWLYYLTEGLEDSVTGHSVKEQFGLNKYITLK
jgi:hypothetical protein